MEEFDLGVQEVVPPENTYNSVPTPSTKNQKKVLYVDAATKAVARGEDLVEAIEEVAPKTVEQAKLEGSAEYVAQAKTVESGVVEMTAMEQPEKLPEVVAQAQVNIEEAGQTAFAAEYSWINNIPGSETLPKEEKLDVAVQMSLLSHFAQQADEDSTMGTVKDFLGMMFLPASPYYVGRMDAELRGKSWDVGDVATAPSKVKKLKAYADSMAPQEKDAFYKSWLIPTIENITDNIQERLMLANMFTSMTDAEVETFWVGLEEADAVLIASQIASGVVKLGRGINSINKMAKVKNTMAAREVAEAVAKKVDTGDGVPVTNSTVGPEVGIHQTDAAAVGNPLIPEGVFDGAPAGLQGKFRNYFTDLDDHLAKAKDSLDVVINPNKKEVAEIAASVEKRLKKDFDLENFSYTRTDKGLNFKFDKYDGDELVESGVSVDFNLGDLGGLQQSSGRLYPPGARHVLSPLAQAGKDAYTFIKSAAGAMYATERSRAQYTQALSVALSPLKGKFKSQKSFVQSADRIDEVMRALENTSEIPSYRKLVMEGVSGIKLTESEYQAYSGVRKILDDLWWENNDALRREWSVKGIKSIKGGEKSWFARAMETEADAVNSYSGGTVAVIKDGVVVGEKAAISADDIAQLYSEGLVLTKSWASNKTEWFKTPSGLSEYAITSRLSIDELPQVVMNRVPNYLPRVNEDARFFLKKRETIVVNGVKTTVDKAVAFGETEAQMWKYLDDTILKIADENPESLKAARGDYIVAYDREAVADSSSLESISLGGGLVRGHRSSQPLIHAGTGSGKQTNVVDSVQSYLSVTADKVNMTEWRAEARHRVLEEAATYPEIASAVREAGGWVGFKGIIENSNIPYARKQKLLAMHDQVDSMSRIPTASEKTFQDFVVQVGKRFDSDVTGGKSSKVSQGIAKFLYKYSDENPTNIAKSWTFNLTLGMYNPAQIITQASGITAAYSIHPIHAVAATPRWLLAGALDFTTNERAAEGFLKLFAKNAKVDAATMQKDYAFWRKSGMYESVIAGNADAASMKLGLPYDAGFLRRAAGGFVDKGRIPFNIGEVANMRVSFFTALERAKKINPKFSYSDKDLIDVLGRAEDLRLNMSAANKSSLQKGFFGLTTQFLNIQKATAETALSSNLTRGERGRFAIGQIGLYGTAGIPLVGHVAENLMASMGVVGTAAGGEAGFTSEELNIFKSGSAGLLLAGLGMESALASKLTLGSTVFDTLVDSVAGDEVKVQKALFGASYRTGDRLLDTLHHLMYFGKASVDHLLADDADMAKVKLTAIMLAKSLADLPSSGRQIQAALDLNNGLVRRSDGTPLMHIDANIREVYAQALGIPLEEVGGRYELAKDVRDIEQRKKDWAARILSTLHTLHSGLMGQDLGYDAEAAQYAASMLKDMARDDLGDGYKDVMKMVSNKIRNPDNWKDKSSAAIFKMINDDTASNASKMSVTAQRIMERGR